MYKIKTTPKHNITVIIQDDFLNNSFKNKIEQFTFKNMTYINREINNNSYGIYLCKQYQPYVYGL